MNCPICDDQLTLDNCINTECNHAFCKKCFWKWTKTHNSCPLCRSSILANTEELREMQHIRKMLEERQELTRQINYFSNELQKIKQDIYKLSNKNKNSEIITNIQNTVTNSHFISNNELNNIRLETLNNLIRNY